MKQGHVCTNPGWWSGFFRVRSVMGCGLQDDKLEQKWEGCFAQRLLNASCYFFREGVARLLAKSACATVGAWVGRMLAGVGAKMGDAGALMASLRRSALEGTTAMDGQSIVSTSKSIADLCGVLAIDHGELFEAALCSCTTLESEGGQGRGTVKPKGLYLAAYVCHYLLVSGVLAGKGCNVRFVEKILPLLLVSQDGECEQSACDFIAAYAEGDRECRAPLSSTCIGLLQRSSGSLRHQGRASDRDDDGEEDVAVCSASVAARACAALVLGLKNGNTPSDDDEQILESAFGVCLEKLSVADSVTARAISNALLPRFFESMTAWEPTNAGPRLVGCCLGIRDHASALLPLCSAPAAICSIPRSDPLSGRVCELLRACLHDARSHTARKRAQHLVSVSAGSWTCLADTVGWRPDQWSLFCGILDACEDTSAHLINAAWDQIGQLSEAGEQGPDGMLWLEALFSRALQHQKVTFRHRALRTIASHPKAHRFSQNFIIGSVFKAADDAQLLKASKLNSEDANDPVALSCSLDQPLSGVPSISECLVRIFHMHVAGLSDADSRSSFYAAIFSSLKQSQASPRCCLLAICAATLSAEAGSYAPRMNGDAMRELIGVINGIWRAVRNSPVQICCSHVSARLIASLRCDPGSVSLTDVAALLMSVPLTALAGRRQGVEQLVASLDQAASSRGLSAEVPKVMRGLLLMPDKGEEEAGDWVDWREHSASLARVCAIQRAAASCEPLGIRLGQLYSNAYMPPAARERAISLFVSLVGESSRWNQNDVEWISPLLLDGRDSEVSAHVISVVGGALRGGAGGSGADVCAGDIVTASLSALEAAHALMPKSQAILEAASQLAELSLEGLGSNIGGLAAVAAVKVVKSIIGTFGLTAKDLGVKIDAVLRQVSGATAGPCPPEVREREWSAISLLLSKEKLACLVAIFETRSWKALASDKQLVSDLLGVCMTEAETAGEGHAEEVLMCMSHVLPVEALGAASKEDEAREGRMVERDDVDAAIIQQVLSSGWDIVTSLQATAKGKANSKGTGWKKVGKEVIEAFLDLLLQPRLWSVKQLHSDGGPIRRIWEECFEHASHSARLMKLLVSRSCLVWKRYPDSIIYYSEHVAECCVYGLPEVSDSIADVDANDAPLSELASFSDIIGGKETFVRVLVTRMLVQLVGSKHAVCSSVMMQLLEKNSEIGAPGDKAGDKGGYSEFSFLHKQKMRCWQALAVIAPLISDEHAAICAARVLDALKGDERKSVRFFMEITASSLVRGRPELIGTLLAPLLLDYNANTDVGSSYMLLVNFVLRWNTSVGRAGDESIRRLMQGLLPWVSHHSHLIRVLASLAIRHYDDLAKFHPDGDCDRHDHLQEKMLCKASVDFMTQNSEVVNLHVHLHKVFFEGVAWGDMNDHDKVFRPVVSNGEVWGERIPEGMAEKIEGMMRDYQKALRLSEEVEGAHAGSLEEGDSTAPIQRKYQPDTNPVNSGPAQRSEYKEAVRGQVGDLGAQRGKLIVVASLIDKAPNLAGMARTCEVFQATELIVANKEKLLKDEVFKQVAVSADRWVPISEVTLENLPTYLDNKTREGWVLVGLEQASDSVALQNYTFPPKAILILGKEKEGIPQTLLQRLDDVVEIPQLGMIRSLNVHVSAACMIWQWTQQNLLKAAALPAAHGT